MLTSALMALIRRDLMLFLRDRRAVVMSVVAPIVIASFFGYIFGGGAGGGKIPIVVADNDGGSFTSAIVKQLESDAALEVRRMSEQQARDSVRNGKTGIALIIPPAFGASMAKSYTSGGPQPAISMPFDPAHRMELRLIEGIVAGAVMEVAGRQLTGESQPRRLLPFRFGDEEVASQRGGKYNGYAHSFAGMAVQFLLLVGAETGIAFLIRKQHGTWKRLRAAPIPRTILLGSRVLSTTITSTCTLLFVFLFARIVFDVHIEGSFLGFLGVCIGFALMTATFGLLIASLGRTPEATRPVSTMLCLFLVMLGGAWVPTFIFPKWLQSLTVVIPTRWAVDGLDAVTWRGLGFSSVAMPIVLLLLCSAVLWVIAVMRFRWETD